MRILQFFLRLLRANSFDEYQKRIAVHAVYPENGTGSLSALQYCALGLCGEAGELANKIKKLVRDGDTPEKRAALLPEIGDVQWYLARMASELNAMLGTLADENVAKCDDRRKRGTTHGSGDYR